MCSCFFLQQGRQTKRQVFLLPGCSRMLKVQTSSVSYFIHACFAAKRNLGLVRLERMPASGLYFGINGGGPITSQGSLGILKLLCGGHAITLVSALRLMIFIDNLRYCYGLFFSEASQYSIIIISRI